MGTIPRKRNNFREITMWNNKSSSNLCLKAVLKPLFFSLFLVLFCHSSNLHAYRMLILYGHHFVSSVSFTTCNWSISASVGMGTQSIMAAKKALGLHSCALLLLWALLFSDCCPDIHCVCFSILAEAVVASLLLSFLV